MTWTREEKCFWSLLIKRQIHENLSQKRMQPLSMIMIYYCDKKLKKGLHVLEAYIIPIKKQQHWFNISSSEDAFLEDVFQMTTIALVSVISHYQINRLHLFSDTLYIYIHPLNILFYHIFVFTHTHTHTHAHTHTHTHTQWKRLKIIIHKMQILLCLSDLNKTFPYDLSSQMQGRFEENSFIKRLTFIRIPVLK